jgi:molybdopterin/thiamine biosynthesis adenylyltransferase
VRYPRLKPALAPQLRPNGAVWFGPWLEGLATELDDVSGVLWSLCELLDGTRARGQLVAEIADAYPGQVTDAEEILDLLIGSGWVQDAQPPIPAELTARDLERHRRGIEFLDTVNLSADTDGLRMQARLKASRVTVLGLGGVGSAVVAGLAASGVGHVHCVDHDVVELSNLSRQMLFTESDLGRGKVEATVRRLRDLNGDIEITGEELRLDGADSVIRAIAGSDAFVLCADTPRDLIRSWVNEAALRTRLPWLTAGYAGPAFSLATFIPGRTGCQACLAAETARLHADGDGLAARLPGHIDLDTAHPVTAATAQISGSYLAIETINLLVGLEVQTAGRNLVRHMSDYASAIYTEFRPRPDCPRGCGELLAR